jgi:hypothetical protein
MDDPENAAATTGDQADAGHLESLDKKLAVVRTRTRSVADGFTTGFYLWGEGGISKSYTVEGNGSHPAQLIWSGRAVSATLAA